jgi:hypothetical protein
MPPSSPSPDCRKDGSRTLDVAHRVRRLDRIAARAALAATFAHELATPLNVALGRARMVLASPRLDDSLREDLERVVVKSRHVAELLRRLVDDERIPQGNPQALEVASFVDEVLAMFAPWAEERGIGLAREGGEGVTAMVDETLALQLVTAKVHDMLNGTGGKLVAKIGAVDVERPDDPWHAPGRYVGVWLNRYGATLVDTTPDPKQAAIDEHVVRAMGGFVRRDPAEHGCAIYMAARSS